MQFNLYLWVFWLHLSTMCVPSTHGEQRESDPLELDLQIFVNYHIGEGN